MVYVDDIGFGGMRLAQDGDGFKFGIDAVLLADFAVKCCPSARNAADLGAGNGVASVIVSHKMPACNITGIEIQEEAVKLAKQNVEMNGLSKRIDFIHGDICRLPERHSGLRGLFDMVFANPPYVARGSGIVNEKSRKFIARHETTAGICEFAEIAAWLLRNKGDVCFVHRPARLADVIFTCRINGLEPKDIRFVKPAEGKKPNIFLLHCVLGGGTELHYMDELIVRKNDGQYSPEILEIYEKTG